MLVKIPTVVLEGVPEVVMEVVLSAVMLAFVRILVLSVVHCKTLAHCTVTWCNHVATATLKTPFHMGSSQATPTKRDKVVHWLGGGLER